MSETDAVETDALTLNSLAVGASASAAKRHGPWTVETDVATCRCCAGNQKRRRKRCVCAPPPWLVRLGVVLGLVAVGVAAYATMVSFATRKIPTLREMINRNTCASDPKCEWCAVPVDLRVVPFARRVAIVGPPGHDVRTLATAVQQLTRVSANEYDCFLGGGVLDFSCTSALFAQHVSVLFAASATTLTSVPGFHPNAQGALYVVLVRDPRESAVAEYGGANFDSFAPRHARMVRDHWRFARSLSETNRLVVRHDEMSSTAMAPAHLALRVVRALVADQNSTEYDDLPSAARMLRCVSVSLGSTASRNWQFSFRPHPGLLQRFCDELSDEWDTWFKTPCVV